MMQEVTNDIHIVTEDELDGGINICGNTLRRMKFLLKDKCF